MTNEEARVDAGNIGADDPVLLHINGGNEALLKRDFTLHRIQPACRVRPEEITEAAIEAARDRLVPAR